MSSIVLLTYMYDVLTLYMYIIIQVKVEGRKKRGMGGSVGRTCSPLFTSASLR